jgi:3-hydroxyisobutyrate dehydrogenase-like beta-hydroxyacid dehydrogenase
MSQRVFVLGDVPKHANVVKLAGNFLITCVIEGLAEATAFAEKAGVDRARFVDVLTHSLFDVPAYRTYGPLIVEGKFSPPGFKLPLGFKDNRLLLRAAEALDAPLPFASVVHDHFLAAIAAGFHKLDWSALALIPARAAARHRSSSQA